MRARGAVSLALALAMCGGATQARAATGGPDAYGYVYRDSSTAGGPAYAFEDISASGTQVVPYGYAEWVTMPFTFVYYGAPYTGVSIGATGMISLTDMWYYLPYYPHQLPGATAPNNVIAGYWNGNLCAAYYCGGSVRYATLGTPGARRFIIQYTGIAEYYCYGCPTLTMQIKLFEGTGVIEVHYVSVPGSGFAGIENDTGSTGLSYFAGAAPTTPRAVRYRVVPPPTAPEIVLAARAMAGESVELNARATDPSGYDLQYAIDWGDGSGVQRAPDEGSVPQGETITTSHTYRLTGTYLVSIVAVNALGRPSSATEAVIEIVNAPPDTPAAPAGPPAGTTLLDVEFASRASDPSGDPVAITIEWGDGSSTRVPAVGFAPSGSRVTARHRYAGAGAFEVFATAIDPYGSSSARSEGAPIQVLL